MKDISTKEWWIGLIVGLVAFSLAAIFEPGIKDGMLKEIRTYQQALQVDNAPPMYVYAKKTNVGNVLAYGTIAALQPVTVPELKQAYGSIVKVKEHYTRHTRQVCSGHDKKGKCTGYRTEVYYTWDTAGVWRWKSAEWDFLSVKFGGDQLDISEGGLVSLDGSTMNAGYEGYYSNIYLYESSLFGLPTGNDRYYFKVMPITFVCTIFSKFIGGTTADPITGSKVMHVWDNTKPSQIIQQKKDNLVIFDIAYFSIIVILCVVVWYWIAYESLNIQ